MDETIIELIRARRDDGLELLQEKYAGLMRYVAGGILQNPDDTEECISDICMKVWHSIERYREEKGKFSTWLTVISRNTALTYLHRKGTKHATLNENTQCASSPEEEVLRREHAEELKQALSVLTTEEQHIFYRKYYYLQQIAQIAAELGLTERSVEGKLYRIRKKLQKRLGACLVERKGF